MSLWGEGQGPEVPALPPHPPPNPRMGAGKAGLGPDFPALNQPLRGWEREFEGGRGARPLSSSFKMTFSEFSFRGASPAAAGAAPPRHALISLESRLVSGHGLLEARLHFGHHLGGQPGPQPVQGLGLVLP